MTTVELPEGLIGCDPGVDDLIGDDGELDDVEALRGPRWPRPRVEERKDARWQRRGS